MQPLEALFVSISDPADIFFWVQHDGDVELLQLTKASPDRVCNLHPNPWGHIDDTTLRQGYPVGECVIIYRNEGTFARLHVVISSTH